MKKFIICLILLFLETSVFANGGIVCSPPKGGSKNINEARE